MKPFIYLLIFCLPVTPADVAGKGIVDHLQRQAVVQGASAVVGMATGASPVDALKGAVVGAVAGTVGGVGAGAIGDAYKTGVLDVVTHKLAHAGLGAIGGSIINGARGARAGALGAFVAETFADSFSPEKPMERVKAIETAKGRKLTPQEFTAYYQQELEVYGQDISRVQDWAKVTAATTALLAGQDVSVATSAATVAVENNFAVLAYYGVVAAGLAYSAYEIHNAYETGGVEGALKQLGIEIVTDVAGAAALRVGGKVAYKIGSTVYPTVEVAVTAALDKTPGLKLALGRLVDKLSVVGEKVSQSAVGQSVAKAEAAIAKAEAKIAEKVGLSRGVQEVGGMVDNYAAKMPSSAVKLRTELALKDAGILDAEGKLTKHAIENSVAIDLKGTINNSEIRKILTEDGSNIAHWNKYHTPSTTLLNGQRVQVHYYRNDVTGKIDYVTRDFKVKGDIIP